MSEIHQQNNETQQTPVLTLDPSSVAKEKVQLEETTQQLEAMAQAAPSATAAAQAASEAVKQMDTTMLTEEDKKSIEEFVKKIDVNNSDHVLLYGADAQKKIADFSDSALATIRTKDNLIHLNKRGRMLVASYEAIRFQKLDLFSVTLRQIGAYINRMHVADAIDVICNGDGNKNGADRYTVGTTPIAGTAGTLSYDALVDFWSQFDPYTMNTLLVGDAMAQILKLEEMQDSTAGLGFQGTGKLVTPMGATLLRSSAVPSGTIIGLDRQYALELVRGSEVLVEYDKLIDRQLERAAITSISGFAKVFQPASKVLQIGTAGGEG